MSYRVEFTHRAAKEMKRLDRTTIKRLEAKIDTLALDPFDPRISKQMETDPDCHYARVGDWRIIYRVEEATRTINVTAIRPRSSAYK